LILVDTSVWIDHFHKAVPALADALDREEVMMHPYVLGEIACGEIKRRREILDLLATLPASALATDEETLGLIENRRLMGKGIGYIDVHLLAAVIITDDAQLWTRDKRLGEIAARLGIGFSEPS
jgi:predicted nucleic acid-binding protein